MVVLVVVCAGCVGCYGCVFGDMVVMSWRKDLHIKSQNLIKVTYSSLVPDKEMKLRLGVFLPKRKYIGVCVLTIQ